MGRARREEGRHRCCTSSSLALSLNHRVLRPCRRASGFVSSLLAGFLSFIGRFFMRETRICGRGR